AMHGRVHNDDMVKRGAGGAKNTGTAGGGKSAKPLPSTRVTTEPKKRASNAAPATLAPARPAALAKPQAAVVPLAAAIVPSTARTVVPSTAPATNQGTPIRTSQDVPERRAAEKEKLAAVSAVAPIGSPQMPVKSPQARPIPASTDGGGGEEGQRAYQGGQPLLFEVGWEVCWQLGGIYTVLRSKADAMIDRWDDRYCLIGPYNPATAPLEFEERPTEGVIRETLDRLRAHGIPCHFGRWLIPGRPRVILLDYRARYRDLGHDKYLLWKDHGISVSANDGEVNEVVAFGFTVAEFFRELSDVVQGKQRILAHFHEWMAGVAVPRMAYNRLPVTTVFTTHATLLGRYMAGDNPHFYDHLPFINGDEQAAKYQIWPKHAIERAAAHACTVFTTVSEVTGFEAERLLGRRPDAILPNGLNIQRFAALHEFQNLHRQYKERIHEFVMGHFFPGYTFDLNNTLYFFTSGRYEYTNKGIDLFIEAMWRLNQRMKTLPAMLPRPTVIGFIITRAATRNISVGVLQNQSMFDELRATCGSIQDEIGRRLFNSAANGRVPTFQELLPEDTQVRLKRAIHAWRHRRQPPIVTHDLVDDGGDPTLRHLRHRHLFNSEDDPVKMIFHPEFVSATSPLISLDYPQFVRGCNLGIFPSYYEPWGYTPMESIAMGVPAVTTDLSGFGAFVQRHIPNAAEQGVLVLNRRTQSFDRAADDLTNYLFDFVRLNRRQRIEGRNKTERLGELFDWSQLVKHYHHAHDLALERSSPSRSSSGKLEIKLV
ncbi:MAG: glycosyltransferase, partial [Tepidisphaeraceae bacterium]